MPRWLRGAYRFLFRGATYGIAKNDAILAAFERLGFESRAEVIGTFLQPVCAANGRPLPREVETYFASHPLCVTTAGFRFEPLYHIDSVVRAVSYVRRAASMRSLPGGVGLIVLGSEAEDPEGKAAFDRALAETGLGNDVLVLRDVDFALDVIARSKVFVRATDFDGDANTVKEAMMLGVPVLATALLGRPPGVELIGVDEIDSMGERILAILLSRDESKLDANRAFVRDDIARNGAAILVVYNRVTNG